MMHYGRSDTHYLLFIYDNLRNALLDLSQSRAQSRAHTPSSNPEVQPSRSATPDADPTTLYVREVLSRSEVTALRVCEHGSYDAEGLGSGGWDTLARKWNKGALAGSESNLNGRIYKKLHAWRDHIARQEDRKGCGGSGQQRCEGKSKRSGEGRTTCYLQPRNPGLPMSRCQLG